MIQDDWHLRVSIQAPFMSSRADLVSIEHLLNDVCAAGFQTMYKLLLNCMWYRGSRQIRLLRGNQPVRGLLDTVTLGWLTRGLKWSHDKMAALCWLRTSLEFCWCLGLIAWLEGNVLEWLEGNGLSVPSLYLQWLWSGLWSYTSGSAVLYQVLIPE